MVQLDVPDRLVVAVRLDAREDDAVPDAERRSRAALRSGSVAARAAGKSNRGARQQRRERQ
jgi:hypothetical protein